MVTPNVYTLVHRSATKYISLETEDYVFFVLRFRTIIRISRGYELKDQEKDIYAAAIVYEWFSRVKHTLSNLRNIYGFYVYMYMVRWISW